jgi:enterochelin esterase family protein
MTLKRTLQNVVGLLLLATSLSVLTTAQTPPRQPTPNDTLVSPEALSGGRVTFRIYAPKASEVTLRGDWMEGPGTVKLEKDDKGVWSSTVGPLVPDFYSYAFVVDGVRTLDPKNAMIKQGLTSLDNMFLLPGAEAAFEDNQTVSHGELRSVWYQSSTLSMQRRLHIYFPPGYESGKERYPVFYLLHGGGDEDSGWSTIGRAGFILDNLIAAKKARPMIVVMPNGSLPRPPVTPGAPPDPAVNAALQDRFVNELLKDIVPLVEKSYRVLAGRDNPRIAGLSMGGGQTTRCGHIEPRSIRLRRRLERGRQPADDRRFREACGSLARPC